MDNNNRSIFNFELNDISKSYLQGIAQWAKITAVAAFVSVGLSLVSSLIIFSKFSSGSSLGTGFVSWVISLLLNILLFSVAKSLLNAVLNTDQGSLNKGLTDLAKYLRVIGILCIVIGAILVIAFFIALTVGTSGGFR